jgi:hypothetical protein
MQRRDQKAAVEVHPKCSDVAADTLAEGNDFWRSIRDKYVEYGSLTQKQMERLREMNSVRTSCREVETGMN